MLRDFKDDGLIAKQGKALHEAAALPPTVMADITGRDSDGELIAAPTEWDEEQSGAPPKIRIHMPRRPQPGTAAGVGDRALLRIEKPDTEGGAYSGRVIKIVDHAKNRVPGIFRSLRFRVARGGRSKAGKPGRPRGLARRTAGHHRSARRERS